MQNIEPLLDMGFLSRDFDVSDATRQLLASEEFTDIGSFNQDTILIQQAMAVESLPTVSHQLASRLRSANEKVL